MAKAGDKLMLPVDAVIGDKFDAEANSQVVDVDKVPAGWRVLDIGPKSIAAFSDGAQGRQARGVERADGRVRVPEIRRRHVCHRQAAGRTAARRPSSAAATRRPRSRRRASPSR